MTDNTPLALTTASQKQVDLIKSIFKDNEYLLKTMRNLFFGFEMTEGDKELIRSTFSGKKELQDTVRKKIFPHFEDTIDLPIGVAADYWLDIEKDILGAFPDAINQRVSSKQKVYDMITQAIGLLENPQGTAVDMSYNPKLIMNDPLQINLLARSLYIRSIGQGLTILKMIADQVEKSPEEIKKTQTQNSTK